MTPTRCVRHLGWAVVGLLLALPAWSQSPPPLLTDQVLGGTGGQFENIELSNGGVNLSIPVLKVRGRGLDFFYQLDYTSKTLYISRIPLSGSYWTWKNSWTITTPDALAQHSSSAIVDTCQQTVPGVGIFTQPIWTYFNDVFTFPDGSQKLFPVLSFDMPQCDQPPAYSQYPSAYSTDLTSVYDDNWGYLKMSDGSIPGADSNGNSVSRQYVGAQTYNYTDSLGRVVLTTGCSASPCPSTLTLNDGRVITLKWNTIYLTTSFANPAGAHNLNQAAVSVLTEIDLPNNRAWQFEYANYSYGQLTKVTLPTGGYIRYTYGVQSQFAAPEDALVVTGRYVSADGVSEQAETYSYSTTVQNGTVTQRVVTLTKPTGDVEIHTFQDITGMQGFRQTDVEFRQGTSQTLRKIHTDWACDDGLPLQASVSRDYAEAGIDSGKGNCRVAAQTTTEYNAGTPIATKKVQYQYDSSLSGGFPWAAYPSSLFSPFTTTFGNVTQVLEYDWGAGTTPGPLLRETDITYLSINAANGNLNYQDPGINIVRKPILKVVKNGSGNILSQQTQYEYDGSTLTATSGVPQHDYTRYAASNRARGNLTKVSRWLNTTGGWPASTNTYDDLGNLRTSTDPGGHLTSYSYADNFNDGINRNTQAYLSLITYPTTGSVQHTERKSYYYSTGLAYQFTDQNGQVTTYTYDVMNRLASVTYPDGGQTTVSYNDTPPVTVSTTTKITSSLNLVSTSVGDGLGRPKQSQLNSDPQGVVYSDTTYDSLGRKSTVSNPYRSTFDPTYGITTTVYDALSRATQVIPPDGTGTSNNVTTVYSGNTTTVTDQAGKKRKSATDALGRLITVWEPDSSGNFVNETDYTYDVLNNLTSVVQSGSRQRTFAYNSLSQLTSASNPESGTVSYAYDNDGNLLTKTDARAITTTDAYDQLQRLTGKTFSNGDPAISYFYDQTSYNGLTIANGIGRRTGMSDAAGAEAWSYDPMGRVLAERRTTNAVTKSTSYAYNLDASMASLTYPSGRMITYTPSAAGRPVSAVDTANSINYALNGSYAPHGALASLLLGQTGSFGGITLSQGFNSRLQPSTIQATSTNGTVVNLAYGFNLGASNNGNVVSIANNLNTARTQNFTYDELNRIKTAQTQATTGTYAWGLQFGYDIWANLLSATVTQGSAPMLSVTATTNNQISGFCYDAAGNLLAQSAPPCPVPTYTYDAENRMTSTAGVNYTYDGDGNRVQKSSGKLYWYGLGSDPLMETDAAGNTNNASFYEYIFFGGKRIARRDSSTNVFFYFEDHLGTSRVITQANGAPCYDADFYPFGGEIVYTNTCPQNYKFTGKERDSESGLDNFGARYNSSNIGRFMSPDQRRLSIRDVINPQKWNKYAYTINNPLRYFDPNGMEEIEVQLRAFIPQSSVAGFRGDNRGFTTAQNVTSRTSITVRVETDPAKSQNPLLNTPKGVAGQTQFNPTGTTATQTEGLPTAQVSRDANGNVVINLKQDASNPLVPGAPPIKSDLTVTIPASGSSVTTAGTVSGAPAFELNVSTEGGTDVNVPLQNAPSSTPGFITGLPQTNSILNFTPLPPPPPPPPPCTNNKQQTSCPK